MKILLFLTAKREQMSVMYVFSKLSAICNSAHTWNRSGLLVHNSFIQHTTTIKSLSLEYMDCLFILLMNLLVVGVCWSHRGSCCVQLLTLVTTLLHKGEATPNGINTNWPDRGSGYQTTLLLTDSSMLPFVGTTWSGSRSLQFNPGLPPFLEWICTGNLRGVNFKLERSLI